MNRKHVLLWGLPKVTSDFRGGGKGVTERLRHRRTSPGGEIKKKHKKVETGAEKKDLETIFKGKKYRLIF